MEVSCTKKLIEKFQASSFCIVGTANIYFSDKTLPGNSLVACGKLAF